MKGFCVNFIEINLKVDTAIPILTRAFDYKLQDLQDMTLEFIKKQVY